MRLALDHVKKELLYCCHRRINWTVFEFFAVGNRLLAVLFSLSRVAYDCNFLPFYCISYRIVFRHCHLQMIIRGRLFSCYWKNKDVNSAHATRCFITDIHVRHTVPSRKWDKTETNSNKRFVVKFSSWLLHLARPRECVWGLSLIHIFV